MQKFNVMVEASDPSRKLGLHVVRYLDGAVLEINGTGNFVPPDILNGDPIVELHAGNGLMAGLFTYQIEITDNFVDGVYVVFHHDLSRDGRPIYNWESFGVVGGMPDGVWSQDIGKVFLSRLSDQTFAIRAVVY